MAIQPTPPVSRELVEYLEKLYPDRAPKYGADSETIWMDVGSVRVVRKLRSLFEKQTNNVLENG